MRDYINDVIRIHIQFRSVLDFRGEEIVLHRSMVSKSTTAIGNSNCKGLHIVLECIFAARNSSNKPFGV